MIIEAPGAKGPRGDSSTHEGLRQCPAAVPQASCRARCGGPLLLCGVLLAPVIFIFVVAARAFGRVNALADVDSQLGLLIGQNGAHSVDTLVRASQHNVASTPMFFGTLLVLIAVFAIFMQIQEALDDVWDIPEQRRGGAWEIIVLRLHVVIAIFVLAALAVAALFIAETGGRLAGIAANTIVLLLFLTVAYRTLPREEVSWRSAVLGALITGIILLLGQAAMSQYFLRFHPENGYGAAGSFMVILIWIYYSAHSSCSAPC